MQHNEPKTPHPKLPRDEFGRGETWHWIVLVVPGVIAALGFLLHMDAPKATAAKPELVVYCAQDMVYAEPILREFERQNSCIVRAVFDSEAVKTVGLANRLLAERSRPRCDLFWGNEEMRTRQLAAAGVFREKNGWAGFGYRSRRIVVNTNKLALAEAPKSLLDLTNTIWRGKIALAYPQFGTTATHFHALRVYWGHEAWLAWCRALAANEPLLAEGNSSVVKLVGSGAAVVGLTDSDDVVVGLKQGLPLDMQPLNPESLLIPNTAGVIAKPAISPLTEELFDYLQTSAVLGRLVELGALEGQNPVDIRAVTETLQPDWNALMADLEETSRELSSIFLR